MNATAIIISCLLFLSASLGLAEEGLRDVKAPVAYPSSLIFILIALTIAMVGFLAGFFIRQRLRQALAKRVIILKPWEKALKQLTDLEKENILAREQY